MARVDAVLKKENGNIANRKENGFSLKSDADYRMLFENMLSGFSLYKALDNEDDLILLLVNNAYYTHLGIKDSSHEGKRIRDIFPDVSEELVEKFRNVAFSGDPVTFEYYSRVLSKYFIMHCFCPLHGRVAVMFEDITDKKNIIGQLKILSRSVEQGPASVVITDSEGNIEYVNPKFTDLTGYSLEEVVGQNPRLLKSGEMQDEFYSELWKTIKSGNDWRGIFHNKKKNGQLYWESAVISPVRNDIGEITHFVAVKEDITEKKEKEEKIGELSGRLLLAAKSNDIGIWDYYIEDDKLVWDEAMCKIYGIRYEERPVNRKEWLSFIHPEDIENYFRQDLRELARGQSVNEIHRIVRKDGDVRYIKLFASPQINLEGRPVRITGVNFDITELKRKEIELLEARNKAEEANRLKSNFLANMSHELRTPLVGILGFSEILTGDIYDEDLKAMADAIHTSGKRLLETLNMILDLSRIEANRQEIKLSRINVVNIVNEGVLLYEVPAFNKNLYLKFICPYEEIYSYLDERMLYSIVTNLVSNAVKFTKKGGITVKISKPSEDKFQVEVSDTGIGIPEDRIHIVFEEFRQVSEGMNRSFEGTGLGLTVAKRFTEMLGGTIEVQSTEDKGTKFTVTFKSENVKPDYGSSDIPLFEGAEKPLKQEDNLPVVLVIDDDITVSPICRKFLKGICYVDHAYSGPEGLQMAGKVRYDAVFIDISLGRDMSGFNVLEKLNKLDWYSNKPFIALTAYAMSGDREKILRSGFHHYISKPFDKNNFRNKVQNILSDAKKKSR